MLSKFSKIVEVHGKQFLAYIEVNEEAYVLHQIYCPEEGRQIDLKITLEDEADAFKALDSINEQYCEDIEKQITYLFGIGGKGDSNVH